MANPLPNDLIDVTNQVLGINTGGGSITPDRTQQVNPSEQFSSFMNSIPQDARDPLSGSMARKFQGNTNQMKIVQDLAKQKISNEMDVNKTVQTKAAEYKQKVEESRQTALYNYSLVAGNMTDYAKLLAESYKEGGAGDAYKAFLSEQYEKGRIPEAISELTGLKYPKTSAISGKHFEIVAKGFPTLTQQIGKEGSVRLIESIFNRYGGTIPQTHTPIDAAPEQMAQTIQSTFRIQKAFNDMDLKAFDLKNLSGDEKSRFVEYTSNVMKNMEFSPEEQEVLDETIDRATKPIRDVIASRRNKEASKVKVGSVVNGYKFLGGNLKDRKSWEKQ